MIRGVAGYLFYFAFDKTTGLAETGDAANHTLRLSKDGGANAALTNTPSEHDATYAPGWYKVLLTAAETSADDLRLFGTSSTSNILLDAAKETPFSIPDTSLLGMIKRTAARFAGQTATRNTSTGAKTFKDLANTAVYTESAEVIADGTGTVTRT